MPSAVLPPKPESQDSITEYIQNGKEGFIIEPDDNEQLLKATIKLITDDGLRISMGEQAFKNSKNFYSDIIGEKIKNIYESAINS